MIQNGGLDEWFFRKISIFLFMFNSGEFSGEAAVFFWGV